MPKIIGLVGPKTSGKDLTFSIIQEELPSAKRLGLADALKTCCAKVFGIDRAEFDDQSLKERWLDDPIKLTFGHIAGIWQFYSEIIGFINPPNFSELVNALDGRVLNTRREILQVVGTDFLRTFYPNIHLDVAELYGICGQEGVFVITDCRFLNEIEWVRERGGAVIYIERPEAEVKMFESNHVSEKGIADLRFECDYVLQNRGTIDELKVNLKAILEVI